MPAILPAVAWGREGQHQKSSRTGRQIRLGVGPCFNRPAIFRLCRALSIVVFFLICSRSASAMAAASIWAGAPSIVARTIDAAEFFSRPRLRSGRDVLFQAESNAFCGRLPFQNRLRATAAAGPSALPPPAFPRLQSRHERRTQESGYWVCKAL